MPGVLYMDASALVKLIVEEAESGAVKATVRRWPHRASSIIARVELPLAIRRSATRETAALLDAVVSATEVLELNEEVVANAVRLPRLKALDAIHLGSALTLREQLGGFLTYDRRLQVAAEAAGVPVFAPE